MEQLLVALDVDSMDRALTLADKLRGHVGGFKVGSQLYTVAGPEIVRSLTKCGDRVFLDLKFHDIPNTVAGAVRSAAEMGVWMLTVHASGGHDMLRAAKEAAGNEGPRIVAVTLLTSLDDADLSHLGITQRPLADHVVALAELAQRAGVDGAVASPREIKVIRAACGPSFTIVTPGIRPVNLAQGADDQRRTATAASAVAAGANFLIVGRPIIEAPDPLAASKQLAEVLDP